jgi:hypothetical protein
MSKAQSWLICIWKKKVVDLLNSSKKVNLSLNYIVLVLRI